MLHILSLNNFSHPYPSSGFAGYASSSFNPVIVVTSCKSLLYAHALDENIFLF